MYGAAIPEDAEAMVSKQPRNNQLRVVVALCVGVLIGALGTALLTPAPTPAPRPVLAVSPKLERVQCYRINEWTDETYCFNTVSEMAQLGKFFPSGCKGCLDQFERCLRCLRD